MAESAGDEFIKLPFLMKTPHLELIYRLRCDMAPENHPVGAPFDGSHSRLILPITGGEVKGPRISATILGGADYGQTVQGTQLMRLDARYTLKTDDGHYIYVRSRGTFYPMKDDLLAAGVPSSMSQDDVEWFTRLEFEAGPGPYNWMNGVFAIGVLSMHEKQIFIDAYRMTNFPDVPAQDIHAQRV